MVSMKICILNALQKKKKKMITLTIIFLFPLGKIYSEPCVEFLCIG